MNLRKLVLPPTLLLSAVTLLAPACAIETGAGESAELNISEDHQPLYMQADHVWSNKTINVCWINSDGNDIQHKWVKDAVGYTWQSHANLHFTYWGRCNDALTNVVRIEVNHQPVNDDDCTVCAQLGTDARDAAWGVRLDLTASESYIRYSAIHEFGHVLGAWHEQMRPSNQFATQCDRFQGGSWYDEITLLNGFDTSQTQEVTSYDPWSIMNYCNPANPRLQLTYADVLGIRSKYGYREARRRLWTSGTDRALEIAGGTTLERGQSWTSVNGMMRATMNSDGTFALYRVDGIAGTAGTYNPVQIWNTPTFGTDGARVAFQTDGNLVIYNNANTALWSSNTWGYPGARLVLQNDGNLVIYSAGDNRAIWSTHTDQIDDLQGAGLLRAGESLSAGQKLVTRSKNFSLEMQTDGNLVAYDQNRGVIWASDTYNSGAVKATLQGDGNLVVTRADNSVAYASGTHNHAGAFLALQENGQVVINDTSKYEIWSNEPMIGTFAPTFTTGNAILAKGEQLRQGDSREVGQMRLVMQDDGNLVLYRGTTAEWATGTHGTGATYAEMQADGNLVVYDNNKNAKWASGTDGYRSSILTLTAEGRLSLYRINVNGLYQ